MYKAEMGEAKTPFCSRRIKIGREDTKIMIQGKGRITPLLPRFSEVTIE